jgi:hypothetical protein
LPLWRYPWWRTSLDSEWFEGCPGLDLISKSIFSVKFGAIPTSSADSTFSTTAKWIQTPFNAVKDENPPFEYIITTLSRKRNKNFRTGPQSHPFKVFHFEKWPHRLPRRTK